ncbi:MAG: oligosaccharide flippase family protein [Clostridia bacterium]|nr:oligosaccharide flippase family protein [Clostridia bacterium]
MKINQLKAGAVLSYATQGVHILTGLLYTPVMLRLLGQSEYGLYQLVYSVVSYLSLLSLGFGSSYVRFFSRFKVKGENEEIEKLNGMFMTIFSVIAAICILCGGVMIKNAGSIFGGGLSAEELHKARILLAIMIVNMAVTFINSVFSSIMTAHEKFFFQRLVKLLREIFNPFLTLPLLFMGYGSVAMVSITTILTVLGLFADGFFCIKKLKVRFRFSSFDLSLFKEMWGFTFFIFLGMIVDQLNWSVDKFLLGRMIGTSAVAVYGVAAQLNTLYITLSAAVSAVFISRVNFIVAKNNDNNLLTELFIRVGRIQFLVLGLIVTGYIIFGREFIALWAGKGYSEAYLIGLFLMIPATVPLVQNLGIEIQRAKNMHKARAIVYLLVAIGNIFVSIPCIKKWGATGAAIGTAISLTLGNILFMNWYYHKRMNLDMLSFWKSITGILVPTIFCAVLGKLTKGFLLIKGSLVSLLVVIFLYCVMYAVIIWLFGMNVSEKNLVLKPLGKVGNKLCKK